MAAEPRFDLVLLGFRNDVARERTLALLRRQSVPGAAVTRIDDQTRLPCVVYQAIDHAIGLGLLRPLHECGALVRLVASDDGDAAAAAAPAAPIPEPPPAPARWSGASSFVWLLLLGLGWVALFRFQPPRPALRPAARPLAPQGYAGAARGVDAATQQRLNNEALALSQSGDYAAAVERLREAVLQEPDQPVLRRNLQAVLHNWAVVDLNAGRPTAAVERLDEGLALGEDGMLLGTLGMAQARAGAWQEARTALERAVELGVSDVNVLVALGTVYRQLGERENAVAILQQAHQAGAVGEGFSATLRQLERELDAEWGFSELTSAHFQIGFADGEDRRAARVVLGALEEAYFFVGGKFDFYPSERTPVVLYPGEEFHDITQSPSWTGGVYDGRIKLPVRGIAPDSPLLDRTLRHEFAHVVISQLSRNRLPVWINEGAAIWAEENRDGEREEWAQHVIAGRQLLHLDELDRPFTSLPAAQVPVAYAQSYLAVRAILDGYGSRRLRELLVAIGEGQEIETAFDAVLNTQLATFEAQLVQRLTS